MGARLGNYRLLRSLGQGGMGVVYQAEHALIGSQAAVKVLLPEFTRDPEVVNRFFNEARSTALINHPGLIQVFDFGTEMDGTAYLVMEYLTGESLAAMIKREGRMPAERLVAIARQIASAVGAAHGKGIVHRDLKPDNVFLSQDPEVSCGLRVKVLDFGIAKLTSQRSHMITRVGVVMGTPTYMSPEQCRGAALVDQRSDIYSLGCMLYEMACGRPPFSGDSGAEMISKHIYEPPLAPRFVVSSFDLGLERVLLRALAKSPQERPQTMEELAADLAAAVGAGRSSTAPPRRLSTVPQLPAPPAADDPATRPTTLGSAAGEAAADRPASRRRWAAPAGAAVLIAVVVGGLALSGRSERTPDAAGSTAAVAARAPAAGPAARPGPESLLAGAALRPGAAAGGARTAEAAVAAPTVRLRIDSLPPGAEVFRKRDGARVGVTPVIEQLPLQAGRAEYLVRLDGYEEGKVAFPTDHDGHTYVGLKRRKQPK